MEPKDGVLPGRSRPEVDVNGKLCVSPFSCHLGAVVKDPGHPGVMGDRSNGVCEGTLGGRSGTPAPSRSGPPGAPPGPQTSAWRPELPSEAPAPRRAAARAQRPAARNRQSREVVKSAPLRTFRSSRRGAGGREGRVGERGRVRPSARGLETAFPVRLNARTARHILSPAVTQQHACGREHRASSSCAGPFQSGALVAGPGVRAGSAAGRGRAPRSLDQASGLALVPHVPCCPLGSPFAGPTEVAG